MIVCLLLATGAAPALAEAPVSAAEYDRLLAQHDYPKLAGRLREGMAAAPGIGITLDWEHDRFIQGAGLFVSARYALDLLAVMSLRQNQTPSVAWPDTAVVAALYALAVIETDGAKCADPAAPLARRHQFGKIFSPVGATLSRLSDDHVSDDIAQALLREQLAAPGRMPDDYLCRGVTPDIPVALVGDAVPIEPRFRSKAEAEPAAAAIRAQLPQALTALAATLKQRGG